VNTSSHREDKAILDAKKNITESRRGVDERKKEYASKVRNLNSFIV
jgi:hypothetical protein